MRGSLELEQSNKNRLKQCCIRKKSFKTRSKQTSTPQNTYAKNHPPLDSRYSAIVSNRLVILPLAPMSTCAFSRICIITLPSKACNSTCQSSTVIVIVRSYTFAIRTRHEISDMICRLWSSPLLVFLISFDDLCFKFEQSVCNRFVISNKPFSQLKYPAIHQPLQH